jgi:hypothetical protein
MLVAHANTSSADFIAQLRTFVIAFGCSPMVVDCVDNLAGVDDNEEQHAKELRELEDDTARDTKNAILEAVDAWLEDKPTLAPLQKSLLDAIRAA